LIEECLIIKYIAFLAAIKIWLMGGTIGMVVGLFSTLVADAFSTDQRFTGLEAIFTFLFIPGLAAILVTQVSRLRWLRMLQYKRMGRVLFGIAYLSMLPVFGVNFGASGSEPLWQFAGIGLVAGLFFTAPVAIVVLGWKLYKS
jgi:hypothetical protein